ncbi:hypothetical protein NM058_18080 [Bacillus inaquosorum]|nr:hypothetical protein NM058_18080 [Bacillus inaquosorum]
MSAAHGKLMEMMKYDIDYRDVNPHESGENRINLSSNRRHGMAAQQI